uniref:RIC3 domain-containing protein n=1 Tax=Trichuris muris TaxID=70415 RepID=A0A5S6R3F6_TRIMR
MEEVVQITRRKTLLVFIVVTVSVAVVYPKFIHPRLFSAFGLLRQKPEPEFDDCLNGRQPCSAHQTHRVHEESGRKAQERLPPNYGSHLANSRREKGFWSSLLPFYSIGVIAFLVYTLSKMWLKTENAGANQADHAGRSSSLCRDGRESGHCLRTLNDIQLKRLREQLLETEVAMQKILEDLEGDDSNARMAKNDFQETLENLKRLTDLTAGKLLHNLEERGSRSPLEPSIDDLVHDLENVLERFGMPKEMYSKTTEKANLNSAYNKMVDDMRSKRWEGLQNDSSPLEMSSELNAKKFV